ncbi:hypothetical protein ACLOJK_001744 [Asimina triloba]
MEFSKSTEKPASRNRLCDFLPLERRFLGKWVVRLPPATKPRNVHLYDSLSLSHETSNIPLSPQLEKVSGSLQYRVLFLASSFRSASFQLLFFSQSSSIYQEISRILKAILDMYVTEKTERGHERASCLLKLKGEEGLLLLPAEVGEIFLHFHNHAQRATAETMIWGASRIEAACYLIITILVLYCCMKHILAMNHVDNRDCLHSAISSLDNGSR